MPVTLGYWNIRGLAQTSRHLLSYTQTEFNETQYKLEDRAAWDVEKTDKNTLGLEFPNLPYLIDGDFKLTESKAIERYIIKKSGRNELLGKTTLEQVQVEELLGVLLDALLMIFAEVGNKEFDKKKPEIWKKMTEKLARLQKFIGNREWALGYLTLVDFYIGHQADLIISIFPADHVQFPFLYRIRRSFHALPEIKAYYERKDAATKYLPDFLPFKVNEPKPDQVVLGYWDCRGRASVPRFLLSYYKVDFAEKIFDEANPKCWFDIKEQTNQDFPNLPYLWHN